jgi:hypothetical protein
MMSMVVGDPGASSLHFEGSGWYIQIDGYTDTRVGFESPEKDVALFWGLTENGIYHAVEIRRPNEQEKRRGRITLHQKGGDGLETPQELMFCLPEEFWKTVLTKEWYGPKHEDFLTCLEPEFYKCSSEDEVSFLGCGNGVRVTIRHLGRGTEETIKKRFNRRTAKKVLHQKKNFWDKGWIGGG